MACGLCVTTVKKALNELESAKLIEIQARKRVNKRKSSNLYTVHSDKASGFFKAPVFVFDMELSSKAKLVLFYFYKLSGSGNSIYPAHKTTSKAYSLSVPRARLAINELEANSLITREAQFRADNGQRANLYTLIYPCHDASNNSNDKTHDKHDGQEPIADTELNNTEKLIA